MPKRLQNPLSPLREIVSDFRTQTLQAIDANFAVQRIWPFEVYPGYAIKNAANRAAGRRHSTGRGIRSFRGDIINSNPDDITMLYTFDAYLKYADLGVGQGTSAGDVDRAKDANFKRRYISEWNRPMGRSMRPAIMMEFRHSARRLQNLLVDFWGYEGQIDILNSFEGLNVDLGNM